MSNDLYAYIAPAVISISIALVSSGLTRCRIRREIVNIEHQIQALNSRVTALQSAFQQPLPSAPIYPQAQYVAPNAYPGYMTSVTI